MSNTEMAPRIVCQFSCGAASAVVAHILLSTYPREQVVLLNAFIKEEHEDNRRFLRDCEQWLQHPITVVQSEKYHASTDEVWKKRRYMVGQYGAPCSKELKREVLNAYAQPDDIYALGYTAEEQNRFDEFMDANNGRSVLAPLIERNLRKSDCLAMIERAGIELPAMYRLGFQNANCIGCPKGGAGYWNKIRQVFPERFAEVADIQEGIGEGAKFLRVRREGKDKDRRLFLRELDPSDGRIEDEPEIQCSIFCHLTEQELQESQKVSA